MRNLGPTEILVIVGVVVLLFGGRKLPELARGSGRALRIFKSEVKGLEDDDKKRELEREAGKDSTLNSETLQAKADETSRRTEQS
ncbi:MAG: twin-arginine translocase TatA/TatE family subunit [Actinomycetales bacterium]|nr:MAG: twin-arginine translocase TatA/TatE family subunit [Actinomycetales bacterium]